MTGPAGSNRCSTCRTDDAWCLAWSPQKTGRKEDPAEIKARIAEASKYLPMENLALSPQCGFASIDAGNTISFEDEAAKLKFVADVAAEIWEDA
jgi:5-methyltetrahydropteroyltriglutamate--homocysteine methyltransferase